MSATEHSNVDLVRDYLSAFNDRDRDRMTELLADDVVEHGVHEELHGHEEILEFLDAHFETFPDYAGETEEMVADGDTVGDHLLGLARVVGERLEMGVEVLEDLFVAV